MQPKLITASQIVFTFSHKVRGWNSSDTFEDGHHWVMCQLTIGEKYTFFTKIPFMECRHILHQSLPPNNIG